MPKGKKTISMIDFITAVEESTSIKEVMDKTGMAESSVQARITKYRNPELGENGEVIRASIPLKTFGQGGGSRIDTTAALEHLAKLRKCDVADVKQAQAGLTAAKRKRNAKKAEKKAETEG